MEGSSFGRLSGEIRNRIYRIVLHEPSTIRFCVPRHEYGSLIPSQDRRLAVLRNGSCQNKKIPSLEDCKPPLAISLFAVCRLMRREALDLYFGINCITIYAISGFKTIFDHFWIWLRSLEHHDQKFVLNPQSLTLWLGSFDYDPYYHVPWQLIRQAIGAFHPTVPVRIAVRFQKPAECCWHCPESYEGFGANEFTMLYSHLEDAERKFDWLLEQHREGTRISRVGRPLAPLLALGMFIARMPTFEKRGDIFKPFEVGLPSVLDTLYDPKILPCCDQHSVQGRQMYDFVDTATALSLPRSNFDVGLWTNSEAPGVEEQMKDNNIEQMIQSAVEEAIERIVKQAIEIPGLNMPSESNMRWAMIGALRRGARKASKRVGARVQVHAGPWASWRNK